MRGYRCLGLVHLLSPRDYHPSDILRFSPDAEGEQMRDGIFRARDFDLFQCQTFISMGACPSDYAFVATALGEEIFNGPQQEDSGIEYGDGAFGDTEYDTGEP